MLFNTQRSCSKRTKFQFSIETAAILDFFFISFFLRFHFSALLFRYQKFFLSSLNLFFSFFLFFGRVCVGFFFLRSHTYIFGMRWINFSEFILWSLRFYWRNTCTHTQYTYECELATTQTTFFFIKKKPKNVLHFH